MVMCRPRKKEGAKIRFKVNASLKSKGLRSETLPKRRKGLRSCVGSGFLLLPEKINLLPLGFLSLAFQTKSQEKAIVVTNIDFG